LTCTAPRPIRRSADHNNLAIAYGYAGQPQLGLQLATEPLTLFTQLGSTAGGRRSGHPGLLNLQLGRLDQALMHSNRALTINRDLDA
jgi:hypothetical protein